MQRPGSNFVTPAGLIVLGLLILAAAYWGIRGLEALLIAVLLLSLTAFFWARYALKNIEVEARSDACHAFPGETMEAACTLHNRKFLPVIWLEARFPATGCVAPIDDDEADETAPGQAESDPPCLSETFLWIMPQQSVSWTQRARAVRRGVSVLRELELSSGDGFGLSEQRQSAALPAGFRFVVYPEIRPVDLSPVLGRLTELENHSRGFYTDNTLIRSIRDYRDGDSFRDINWRLLARQGTVQVNVREKLAMRRVCLMPDLESYAYTKITEEGGERHEKRLLHEPELERTLSLIASLIAAAAERDVLCTLALPAVGDAPPRLVIPEGAGTQVIELLTALAEIDYRGEETRFPAEELVDYCHALGQMFLFSSRLSERERAFGEMLGGLPLVHVSRETAARGEANVLSENELFADYTAENDE